MSKYGVISGPYFPVFSRIFTERKEDDRTAWKSTKKKKKNRNQETKTEEKT